ncbi:hypothetical protein KGY72_02270 [Candidatus Bipolaricaulota bacterium]|nr:hypothetical protein [Candidatus Bipolaricaulota bacterium]
MDKKCPGQSSRRMIPDQVVSELECPECGYQVEFFPTDSSRACPECGTRVEKSRDQLRNDLACADWCPSAEECLGPDFSKVKKVLEGKQVETLQALLDSIPDTEKDVKDFFRKAHRDCEDEEFLIDTEKSVKPLKKANPELHEKVVKYYSEFTKESD